MNQKITLQDIVNSVAQKNGMDKKEADIFVRGIFDLIEEALATESYVKVKGLGTFKLVEVDSRESVDVNTGVRIEIQGHRKVSFQPDASLKDLINKPFSHFDIVLLNENTVIEDEIEKTNESSEEEQEESIKTIEVEVSTIPMNEEKTSDTQLSTLESEQQTIESEAIEVEISKDETHKSVEINTATVIVEEEKVQGTEVVESIEKVQGQHYEANRIEKNSKNRVPLFIVITLLLVAGIVYYFSTTSKATKESLEPIVPILIEEESTLDSLRVETEQNEKTEGIDSLLVDSTGNAVIKATVKDEIVTPKLSTSVKYKIVGTKTQYAIQPKENLNTVATKFYGRKEFWIYLVEHNKDIIPNPDNVPINTSIRIPELEPIE